MKNTYILLLIFSTSLTFAQDYIPIDTAVISCSYFYDFQGDSLDRSSVASEEMTLLIGRHSSLFLATNELYRDSVLKTHSNEPFDQNYLNKITPLIQGTTVNRMCRYHIYNNTLTGNTIFTTYLNKKNLKVTEPNKITWKIEANKDSVISGYKCLKASAELWGRKFIAWFTLEIPVGYGPYKFCGLPGLIIKISDTENQHCFTINIVREIKEKQQAIYYLNENYIEISAEDYVKSLQYYFADLYNRVSSGGVVTFQDDERMARSLAKIRSRNNNIEKY
ncbi:MAG: GLPGLI family protein [Bacteroidales bacterium]|nr:GLPGLI family protein [Bacteroidales bacterium]